MSGSFVMRADDDIDAWLEARKRVVTGSHVAAVMGLHPYRTPQQTFDYYCNPVPLKESRHLWWGRFSEEHHLRALESILTPALVGATPTHDFHVRGSMGATLDATATVTGKIPEDLPECSSAQSYLYKYLIAPLGKIQDGERVLVELKQTSERYKKDWGLQPPQHHWAQCQVQMYCADFTHAILFGKVGAADCRGHVIERDDEWLETALATCTQFMEDVNEYRRAAAKRPALVRPA